MAIVGERHGIFPKLKEFVQGGKPVWGTCAGMILLSDKAVMQKTGGQPLIGGLDVEVCRNYFGSQVGAKRAKRERGEWYSRRTFSPWTYFVDLELRGAAGIGRGRRRGQLGGRGTCLGRLYPCAGHFGGTMTP